MRYEVLLTEDAEQDLEDLYAYIAKFDSPKNAAYLLERRLDVAESLATSPERGSQPKELRSLGIQEYRQVFFKPYRATYRVFDKKVVIYVIADGRRDTQSLLSRRSFPGRGAAIKQQTFPCTTTPCHGRHGGERKAFGLRP